MAYNRFVLEQDVQTAVDPIGTLDIPTALKEAAEMRDWMKQAADEVLVKQVKRAFEAGRSAESIASELGWHTVSVYNFLSLWRKRTGDPWYNPRWTGLAAHDASSPMA